MAVIHIYLKHGNVSCTTKEPFIGKEKKVAEISVLDRTVL